MNFHCKIKSYKHILTDVAFWIALIVVLVWIVTGVSPGSVEGWEEGVKGLR